MEVDNALQVFRERIDFEIENSVPIMKKYSEKILALINAHKALLVADSDKDTAKRILLLIRDEETRSEAIKQQSMAFKAAADAVDSSGDPPINILYIILILSIYHPHPTYGPHPYLTLTQPQHPNLTLHI